MRLVNEQPMETLPKEGYVFFRTTDGVNEALKPVAWADWCAHDYVLAWSYTATTEPQTTEVGE